MAKAEISWKRVTAEGVKLQVYARRVSRDWRFFARERRFDQWQPLPQPPLEDWLALLDAVRRLVNRRRLQPDDEDRVRRRIRERFPDAEIQGPSAT
jgi:hypothetical protein